MGEITESPYTYVGTGGSGAELPAPEFSADGDNAMTEFTKGEGGKWSLTAFAELANDALGKDVADSQVKVYRGSSPDNVTTSADYTIKEKKSAVKVELEVETPSGADKQFFKVKFGD